MATVKPRHERNDPNAGMQGAYYTVDIAMSGFTDAESTAGGRLSPVAANDFATKPTTLAQSLLVSRGQLRYKLMLNALQVRSNCRIINMVTTYSNTQGDSPITDINFGIVFENDDFVPTTGTSVDGSTTTTKAMYIADKIGEALSESRTENVLVFDPTEVSGVTVRESSTTAVTAAAVSADSGVIRDAITVTEVSAFAPNTSGQLATDNSLTYSAE